MDGPATTDSSPPRSVAKGRTQAVAARLGREAAVIGLFVLLALVQTRIVGRLSTDCYGGGGGDVGQDVGILHWVSGHLLDPRNIFEGRVYYPSHNSILFTDPLLGPAVLVSPLRLLVDNPILIYNLAVLLVLVTASWGFYRLALELFENRWGAALAGIVIPYTNCQMSQLWHLNLLTLSFFPFFVLALRRLLIRPRWSWPLVAGISFALQAATSGYHAFSCAFVAVLMAAAHWRRFRRLRTWAWAATAAAVAIIVLLPYILGFVELKNQEARLERPTKEQIHFSFSFPMALLVSESYLWRGAEAISWDGFAWARGQMAFFPGFTVVFLAGVAVIKGWRDRRVLALVAVGVGFMLLAMGPQLRVMDQPLGPGPFAVLARWLPLFGAVRHPFTFIVPSFMALGLLAGFGLVQLGAPRHRAVALLLIAAATVETLGPRPGRRPARVELPEVYRFLLTQPPGALLELPRGARWYPKDTGAGQSPLSTGEPRWWTTFHRMPVVNGSGAFEPDRYTVLSQWIAKEWKRASPAGLEGSKSLELLRADFPARYLVVHPKVPLEVRANIEATPHAFEKLAEISGDTLVYRILRGGRGPRLRRAFREDQVSEERIRASVRAEPSATMAVSFNGRLIERRPIGRFWESLVWNIPRGLIHRGMNDLVVAVEDDRHMIELRDLESD